MDKVRQFYNSICKCTKMKLNSKGDSIFFKNISATLTNLLDLLEDELPKDSVDVDIL